MILANQAAAAFKENDRQQAAAIIGELVRNTANLGQNWGGIARIAVTLGEVSLALEAARLFAEVDPNDPQRQLSRAGIMAEAGKVKQAAALIKPFAVKAPENAALHHFMGTAQSQLGDNKSSQKSLRRALKTWETSGQTWLTLANTKKFTAKDRDLLHLQSLQDVMSATAPQVQAPYQYALGKALDDSGQSEDAYTAYATGAALMRQSAHYDPQLNQNSVQNIIHSFNQDGIRSLRPSDVTSNRPIFVMGWPRTGTTLVEQILASHSTVAGGAELNLFGTAISALKGATLKHASLFEQNFAGSENPWGHIAHIYLHLLSERFGAEGRIIDKSLNNGRFLGLIHHIFPQSPVIWMRRNPADAAWSCFKTFFNKGLEWSWSFANIAHHFRLEDALLEHWATLFPDTILQVPYEQLVRDPQTWIPKILSHCDLESEKGVYAFHKTKRTIITASVGQVRRPMTQASIKAADKYIHHMGAFLKGYGI
ncbi:MAG: sulfotransferase [Emcibacter sp.]|nr:sulfotransferase [Emcibacter sp.]